MIRYRLMTVNDIPAGLSLCRSAGWNQIETDWEIFLELSPGSCLVATDENEKVIGTVTTIRYQDHFSWIGMVIVDPARKKQGIGTELLRKAIKLLEGEQTVKLDATPAGRYVYLKLNFADEYALSRLHMNAVSVDKLPPTTARKAEESDLLSLLSFDRKVFGADRKAILNRIWKSAPELGFLTENNKRITGYCFGRYGYNYTQIGPVISETADAATELVSAALKQSMGKPVIIDTIQDSSWLQWLFSIGFEEQRRFTRMYLGVNRYPGNPEKQFAILGPEFG